LSPPPPLLNVEIPMSVFPDGIEKVRGRFEDRGFQERMKGFTKTIQFEFSDTKESYLLTILDGKLVSLEKRGIPDASIVITTTSELFSGIMSRTVDPTAAYFSGKLKVQGDMGDLMRLQPLMM
jgi:putative sterol carrier protein